MASTTRSAEASGTASGTVSRRSALASLAALACMGTGTRAAAANVWQAERPLRMVVPFPAGGISDIFARQVAQRLSEFLGQTVFVDNRSGASGATGTASAIQVGGDGPSLIFCTQGTLFLNTVLYPQQKDLLERQLVPIHGVAGTPVTFVCHPSRPYKTLQEMVDFARRNPEKINLGSPGAGTGAYMAALQLAAQNKIRFLHVPYKGTAPALNDLLAGNIDVMPDYLATMLPHIRTGRLRALAVTSDQGLAIAPDVPTVAAAGFPAAELFTFMGVVMPAGTPAPMVARLSQEMNRVSRDPAYQAFCAENGSLPMPELAAEKFGSYLNTERKRWLDLAQRAGLSPASN